jgi:ABC-type uncharacterized transport system permease subunit
MVSSVAAIVGITAAVAYLAGTLIQARSLLHRTEVNPILLMTASVGGVLLHGVANYLVVYSGNALHLGIHTSASLVSWIMILFVIAASVRLPVENLLVLVLPVGVLGILSLLAAPGDAALLHATNLGDPLIWHILVSIVAYSILFMAACHSVLLAVLEHRLKTRHGLGILRLLPPLQTMETLLFNLLWTGIVALTLAIASGFIFLDDMFQQRVVHHTVLALSSWVLYAILLAGHRLFGWRGTTAVRWTLIAFGLLVLGYFGSKFVIEILLES